MNKIEKILIAKSITIEKSVVDYIWNKIKDKSKNNSLIDYTDKNNKQIELTIQQLRSLFNCYNIDKSLRIIIINTNDINKLKKKKRVMYNVGYKLAIQYKLNHRNVTGVYQPDIIDYIFIYYSSNQLSMLFGDDFKVNGSKIKSTLQHELIHYYKYNVLNKQEKDYNEDSSYEEYLNSEQQYDSFVNNIVNKMCHQIAKIDVQNNKIKRVHFNIFGNKKDVTWQYYVKSFLKRNKFSENFVKFVKKGKRDIIRNIQQKLLYDYKAKNVYENIDEAKKDIENNYYFLYKAINKKIINTNNKKIIYEVVKQLLKNNKVQCVYTLYRKGKLKNIKQQLTKLFQQYQNNNKIYFKLIDFHLVEPTQKYRKYTLNKRLKAIENQNPDVLIYKIKDIYLITTRDEQLLQILNFAYNKLDNVNMTNLANSLNQDAFGEDQILINFCKEKNIELQPFNEDFFDQEL